MKWAIFEFDDNTCEVGETSWIVNEDIHKDKFINDLWLSSTEIIVRWPKDFGKVSRKLGKTPVNVNTVASILCTATIVKFSNNYETIKEHLENYLKTGETKTPNKGRGHRVPKKNARYAPENGVEDEDSFAPKKPKSKKHKGSKHGNGMLNMVKDKYGLDGGSDDGSDSEESSDDDGNEQELLDLRIKNKELQKEVKVMRQEVKDMRQIVSNMKDLTNVNQALSELTKTINSIKSFKTCSTSSSSASSARASSPSLTPRAPSPHTVSKMEDGSDFATEL